MPSICIIDFTQCMALQFFIGFQLRAIIEVLRMVENTPHEHKLHEIDTAAHIVASLSPDWKPNG